MKIPFALTALVLMLSASAHALEVGQNAPCLTLPTVQMDGTTSTGCMIKLNEGTQHLLLDFFSTTCMACMHDMPVISRIAKSHVKGLTTRAIAIDRNETAIRDWIKGNPELVRFPVVLDTNRTAKAAYEIQATPTIFITDNKGKIVYKHVGQLEDTDMAKIEAMVAEQP